MDRRLGFYVLFNTVLVISGRLEVDNETLSAINLIAIRTATTPQSDRVHQFLRHYLRLNLYFSKQ